MMTARIHHIGMIDDLGITPGLTIACDPDDMNGLRPGDVVQIIRPCVPEAERRMLEAGVDAAVIQNTRGLA